MLKAQRGSMKIEDISFTTKKIYNIIKKDMDKNPYVLELDWTQEDYFSPNRLEAFENQKEVKLFKQVFEQFSQKKNTFDDFLFQEYLYSFTKMISEDIIKKDKFYPISFVYHHMNLLDIIGEMSKNSANVNIKRFIQLCELDLSKEDELHKKKILNYMYEYVHNLKEEDKKSFIKIYNNSKISQIFKDEYMIKNIFNDVLSIIVKSIKNHLFEENIIKKNFIESSFTKKSMEAKEYEETMTIFIEKFNLQHASQIYQEDLLFITKNFTPKAISTVVVPYFFKSKLSYKLQEQITTVFQNNNQQFIMQKDFENIHNEIKSNEHHMGAHKIVKI